MEKLDFAQIWPELIGLVPVYAGDSTNGTEIRLAHREPLYSPFRTKTLVRRLARFFTIDLRAARAKYGKVCGRCYAPPLPLYPGLILVPVHARQARFKDDGTRAFLVKGKIAAFTSLPGVETGAPPVSVGASPGKERARESTELRTRLLFTDGSHLDVPHAPEGIRTLLMLAELVEREAALPAWRNGDRAAQPGNAPCCPILPGARARPCSLHSPAAKGQPCLAESPLPGCVYRPPRSGGGGS